MQSSISFKCSEKASSRQPSKLNYNKIEKKMLWSSLVKNLEGTFLQKSVLNCGGNMKLNAKSRRLKMLEWMRSIEKT